MDPDLHRRVSEIFREASELSPQERARFLDRTCAGEPGLRREVESLFAEDERAVADVTPEMVLPEIARLLDEAESEATPRRIGPYSILRKLGEGGMAIVYLAEQDQPLRRTVAIKLIRRGMDTKEVVARFESERQALALMNHPAIAKVFAAGATAEGRPYFVLEYVEGIPITEYCDRNRLPVPQRLRLFQLVCEGVQHAHHKAVIHRDLKPSNVLVSGGDESAAPKIIDFGIAKATARRLTDASLHTELGAVLGTPEYMSPEQAGMTAQDVDTRTDVYALGVMLYELLTGSLPFDSRGLRSSELEEIRRRIREVDPERPSARVARLGREAAVTARDRRAEPFALIRQLRGDLDWITMKALEKEPSRRYGSPAELSADLTRHLEHQPVLAGPPSAVYLARKYALRHRFGVLVSGGLLVLLMAFAVTMAVQTRRIAIERDRANHETRSTRQALSFMQRIFELPNLSRGDSVTAREILDAAAREVEAKLGSEPAIRAQEMTILGTAYASLGLYPQAEGLLEKALATRRRVLGADHPESLTALHYLARLRTLEGRLDESDALLRDALVRRARVLGPDHVDTLASLDALAVLREAQGRREEAVTIAEKSLERKRRALGPEHSDTVKTMANLAVLYEAEERLSEAEALDRDAVAIMKRVLGPEHPDTLRALNNLAVVYDLEAKHAEAQATYEDVLPRMRRVLGAEHPDTLKAMANLAEVYVSQGRHAEAESLDREVLALYERLLGPEHSDTLWVQRNLAVVYAMQGRHDAASKLVREAFDIVRRAFGPEDPDVAETFYSMGVVALASGRRDEALADLGDAVKHGYASWEWMAKDPQLGALHGDPGFDALVQQARGTAEGP